MKARKISDPRGREKEAEAPYHEDSPKPGEEIIWAYLREMVKIPPLTREREFELSRRIQQGKLKIQKLEKPQRDPEADKHRVRDWVAELRATEADVRTAQAEMIQCNLRLVLAIARGYADRGLSLLDLIQEGNLGLIRAVTGYDYRKGFRFSTYAYWWIRQAMTRALANTSKIVRIPVHMLGRKRKVDRAARELTTELGRDPLSEEIAERAELSPKDVRKVMDLMREPLSLEAPWGDEGRSLEDLIESEGTLNLNGLCTEMDLGKKMEELLSLLEPKEEEVLRLRFGIGEPKTHTLEEIGNRFGLSRERIRQIENKALKRLKTHRTSEGIRDILSIP